MRELIDETLNGKRVRRMQRRSPCARRNGARHECVLEQRARDAADRKILRVHLGLFRRTAVLRERVARCVREMMRPRRHGSGRRQAGAQSVMSRGTIVVVLNVVLTRPHDFHRSLCFLRQKRGFGGVVIHESPTESAARPTEMHGDRFRLETSQCRDAPRHVSRNLCRAPHVGAIGSHVGEIMNRLHRNVGEKRDLIHGVDRSRRRRERRIQRRRRDGRPFPAIASADAKLALEVR